MVHRFYTVVRFAECLMSESSGVQIQGRQIFHSVANGLPPLQH